jgi:hypothetical protein
MLPGMNWGSPIAPAYEPCTCAGSQRSRAHQSRNCSSSPRKKGVRSRRPLGKSKASVAKASMTRKPPVMRP